MIVLALSIVALLVSLLALYNALRMTLDGFCDSCGWYRRKGKDGWRRCELCKRRWRVDPV